jgi:hypothetical protein
MRIYGALLLAALLMGCGDDCPTVYGPFPASNQSFNFRVDSIPINFVDITNSGTGLRLGDDESRTVSTGFPLSFGGQNSADVHINSNGYLSLTSSVTNFINVPLPSQLAPENLVAPLWDDWSAPATGDWIFTQSDGAAPNRRFIVMWKNAQSPFVSGDGVTFEAIFQESGSVEFHYPDTAVGDTGLDKAASATVGVQDGTRTRGTTAAGGPAQPVNSNTAIRLTPVP